MLENATEALDLILTSSVSDIGTLDSEEAVALQVESIFVVSWTYAWTLAWFYPFPLVL
jgi:hypothetical protein